MEDQQSSVEQLLSHYERALDEIEAELDSDKDLSVYPQQIRIRLNELAERTAVLSKYP